MLDKARSGNHRFSGYTITPKNDTDQAAVDEWNVYAKSKITARDALALVTKAETYRQERREKGPAANYASWKAFITGLGLETKGNRDSMRDYLDSLDFLHLLGCYVEGGVKLYNLVLPDLEFVGTPGKAKWSGYMSGCILPYAQIREAELDGRFINTNLFGSVLNDVGLQGFTADGCMFDACLISGDGSGARFSNNSFAFADLSELDVKPGKNGVGTFTDCTFDQTRVGKDFNKAVITEDGRPVTVNRLVNEGKLIINGNGKPNGGGR